MLSKPRKDPDGRKDKKGKRTKVKGQNEDFLGSWIGQRPREKQGATGRKSREKKGKKKKRENEGST